MIQDDFPRAQESSAHQLGDGQFASIGSLLRDEEHEEGHRPPEDPLIATYYWVIGGSD
jgi:hypothetical protein